jgi:hypothetical protein
MGTTATTAALNIRRATPNDAAVCGRICFEAFRTVNTQHGFPPDLPVPEVGAQLLGWMFSHASFYCVVAEEQGKIIGSNCLD